MKTKHFKLFAALATIISLCAAPAASAQATNKPNSRFVELSVGKGELVAFDTANFSLRVEGAESKPFLRTMYSAITEADAKALLEVQEFYAFTMQFRGVDRAIFHTNIFVDWSDFRRQFETLTGKEVDAQLIYAVPMDKDIFREPLDRVWRNQSSFKLRLTERLEVLDEMKDYNSALNTALYVHAQWLLAIVRFGTANERRQFYERESNRLEKIGSVDADDYKKIYFESAKVGEEREKQMLDQQIVQQSESWQKFHGAKSKIEKRGFKVSTNYPMLPSINLAEATTEQRVVKWQKEQADKGSAYAQSTLGRRYLKGDGVPKDRKLAVEYLEKAAAQGDGDAKQTLEGGLHPV